MKSAPLPANEADRLKALEEIQLLDTLPEDAYDDITRIATEITGTPIALLTLIDSNRQWFKSKQGVDILETPREYSFCAHAILNPDDLFMVEDARFDERFHDNPFTTGDPNVVFYAGVPVLSANGYPLGSLCVIDNRSRTLSEDRLTALKALAKLVSAHFELRKCRLELEQVNEMLCKDGKTHSVSNLPGSTVSLIDNIESSLQELQASNSRPDQIAQLTSLQEYTRMLKTSLSA